MREIGTAFKLGALALVDPANREIAASPTASGSVTTT